MPIATSAAMPLRDMDLGPEGVTGFYVKFIGQLGQAISDGVIIVIAWRYLQTLPPTVDYPLTAWLSATLLVKLALLLWSLKTAWILGGSLWGGARWLGLESRGMQWAAQGGEMLRVIFYRSGDQILRCDESSVAQRVADDKAGRRYRRQALLRDGALLAVLTSLYYYMPLGFPYFRALLSANWQGDYDRWDVPGLIRLVFLLFVIVPRGADLLMTLLETVIHATGAQFMPGAKVSES